MESIFSNMLDGPPKKVGLIVAVQTKALFVWSSLRFFLCWSEDLSFLFVFAIIVIRLLSIEKSESSEILLSIVSLFVCELNRLIGEVICSICLIKSFEKPGRLSNLILFIMGNSF